MKLSLLQEIATWKKISALLLLAPPLLMLGCASKTTETRWVNPDLMSWDLSGRNMREEWAKKVDELPIEWHGISTNDPTASSAILTKRFNVNNQAANYMPSQRLVLYTNENAAPQRQYLCAVGKDARIISETKGVSFHLQGAICDGPKIIAYASNPTCDPNKDFCNIDFQIKQLEKSLTTAFYPGPSKELCDSGQLGC